MIRNLIGKDWRPPAEGVASLPVFNPATGEVIEQVPLSGDRDGDAAGSAAARAYAEWAKTAVMERGRLMFRHKAPPEEHFEELASTNTRPHRQTPGAARGERRPRIDGV